MQAGNPGAMSVIPAHATLVGTVRTFRPATQDMIERRLSELVPSIAAAFGATATVKFERVYPATINHPRETEFAATVAEAPGRAARMSCAISIRRWGRRISRSCCRRSPVPSPGWARAGSRGAASCTTASTISTTRSFRSAPATWRRSPRRRCRSRVNSRLRFMGRAPDVRNVGGPAVCRSMTEPITLPSRAAASVAARSRRRGTATSAGASATRRWRSSRRSSWSSVSARRCSRRGSRRTIRSTSGR